MAKLWLWIISISAVFIIAASATVFYTLNYTDESLVDIEINAQENALGNQPKYIPNQNLDPELIGARELKFLFFGDMMLDRHVGEKLAGKNIGFLLDNLAGEDKQFFSGFDIVGTNLEGAVTDSGAHYSPQNSYDFAFSPERIAELDDYGFNYFTLANNHFTDQGTKGVEETRRNLQALDFYFSGSPDAQVDEYSLKIVELSGQKVALIGLSMVYAHFDLEKAKELVGLAASTTDLAIINIHWGTEYEHYFNSYQQNIGHALIDAGADVIIGHHPHVVQGMEIYQGKPIFYSLGNFIFDQYFSKDTQEGLAIKLSFSQATTTVYLFSLLSEKSAPRLMNQTEREIFLKNFTAWSTLEEADKQAAVSGKLELSR